ncbi:MAG: TetR/AcrR family transcriptional regulator [Acidobacteria bacterium]|nr:TetR/AcrR family transcriptional regulator [Acidobacteriota bacterium]
MLRAAEAVFARDGFEASRIEDIAGEAGRSRGAFYANFDSKAEVFLALRGVIARRHAREIRERLESITGDEARYAAVTRYLIERICDPQAQILQIEFKLFALRHPEMLDDLSAKHLDASTSVHRQEFSDLFPEKNESLLETQQTTLAIEAVLEGFSLNARFSPHVLTCAQLEMIVPKIFATIFPR